MAERDSTGAARRRRERRLRMHWRHEQLTLRMVLATMEHHSNGALREQTTATRTREGENETHYTAEIRRNPLPERPGTQYYTMQDDESVLELCGWRLAPLSEPLPQARITRHTKGRLRACARSRDAPAGARTGGRAERHVSARVPASLCRAER